MLEAQTNFLELEKESTNRLTELLRTVKFLHIHETMPAPEPNQGVDGLTRIEIGAKKRWLAIEVKNNAQMRDARQAIAKLKQFAKTFKEPCYPVFISQYLSRSIRDYCTQEDVGYFDFCGNCRLVFENIHIEKEVPNNDYREHKHLRSIFSAKSSRVIRRLLTTPQRAWRVQQLAQEASVSPATVSLMKDKLLAEDYGAKKEDGFIITMPEKLLQDWAKHYDAKAYRQFEYYADGELEEVERRFADYCRENKIEYAFTGFSGARRVANFTRGIKRGYAYISTTANMSAIAKDLDFKLVDSGGNIRLYQPMDSEVLWNKQDVDGDVVVSDLQLYLDLSCQPGRGEENAEFLLNHRIRQNW
jgi:hypothetical protein